MSPPSHGPAMLLTWLTRVFLAGVALLALGGAVHAYHAYFEADATLRDLNHATDPILRHRHGDTFTVHLQVLDATGGTRVAPGTSTPVPTYAVTDGTSVRVWTFPEGVRPQEGTWYTVTFAWSSTANAFEQEAVALGAQPAWYVALYAAGATASLLAGGAALAAARHDPRRLAARLAGELLRVSEAPPREPEGALLRRIRP